MDFNISKKVDIDITKNVENVMKDFDVKLEHLDRNFTGSLELPEDWSIGLIVGDSGTGKSTIIKELFEGNICDNFSYTSKSVIDDIEGDYDAVTRMFYAVGFGSVPCWLKPYSVLSNGEKARVDLARALIEKDFVVYDEFTSVVDRLVAHNMCISLNKCMKKYPNKKFVAVTCHKDVEEWLQPDWIFNTDTMQMSFRHAHALQENSKLKNAARKSGQSLGTFTI